LYTYLHASDVLLIHKDTADAVVVSSTAYLCMGSGCPLLVSDTNFFETLNQEVIKYKGLGIFAEKLREILEEKQTIKNTLKAAESYVKCNSDYEIGKRFIELFKLLKAETREKLPVLNIDSFTEIPLSEVEIDTKPNIVYLQNPLDDKNIKSA
ncbi:hypothetical protein J7L81_02715, partial [Candidatus Aerophobetes bacterium]|nr:hypothetical protein [Candidatus Aerophobetes bacterium]